MRRTYTKAEKAEIADIIGGSLARGKIERVAARFNITHNAAIGVCWRILHPHVPSPGKIARGQHKAATAAALAAHIATFRYTSRRQDADRNAKLTRSERRLATGLRKAGEPISVVAAIMNINARIIGGYFTAWDHARKPRKCKQCRVRNLPPGRHRYCGDACAAKAVKAYARAYHRTPKRKRAMVRYYRRVKGTPRFEALRKRQRKEYATRAHVIERRALLFHTRGIARDRGVPHAQVLAELGISAGRVRGGKLLRPLAKRKPRRSNRTGKTGKTGKFAQA